MNNSKLVKIMHIILFVITALYLLESIFLRGLFTNPLIALVNIIVAIIAMVIAFIKKENLKFGIMLHWLNGRAADL